MWILLRHKLTGLRWAASTRYACRFVNDENYARSPWQALLILCAALALLAVGPAIHRLYAASVLISLLAFAGSISYQPWIARLLTGAIVLGSPLVAVAISRLTASVSSTRPAVGGAVALAVTLSGVNVVDNGTPRRLDHQIWSPRPAAAQLLGHETNLTTAIDQLRSGGAKRIGLIGGEETPEFAIDVLLGADQGRTKLITLRSTVSGDPATDWHTANLDAILCVSHTATDCTNTTPPGWPATQSKSAIWTSVLAFSPRFAPTSTH
ncbi:hypothetical protein [Fodinicola acaciae]|uniref:hypothetical protein n=1 Tax=Fodinicola acaciae TaxID=2681555 RepID=UPI0013CFCDEA|nr:hypothetical protein [Fodinicola acaciae]